MNRNFETLYQILTKGMKNNFSKDESNTLLKKGENCTKESNDQIIEKEKKKYEG